MRDFDFGNSTPVRITRHARDQWKSRLSRSALMGHQLNENTWYEAEIVNAPSADCDEQRLYTIRGHRDMLLCGKYHPNETAVVTVLYADYDRLSRI